MYMKRKIIKLGQATFVVSLPSKWIQKYNLLKGDYLEVAERDKKLILSTESILTHKKVTVELPEVDFFLKRLIMNPYRFGYDEVLFEFKQLEAVHKIEEALQYCPGFEIVEQGEKHCVVRNVSPKMEGEFDNIFRRLFYLMGQFLTEAHEIMQEKKFDRMNHIADTENSVVDKLVSFCERVINKRGSNNFMKNSFLYITIWSLEQIGDDIKHVCKRISKLETVSKETEKSWKVVQEFFSHFTKHYFKPDLKIAVEFKDKYKEIHERLLDNMEKVPQKEVFIMHYLASLVTRVHDVAVSIHEFPEDH